ncbi:MAG: zinc ribbon domain-containing protein [Candidatus Obscuribacterales bacterium]|nr:zinc ribbon domain-containing protein [Candidatus Obscuribacterales bacterium]
MPSYDYRCKACSSNVTLERSMSDDTPPVCTDCGSEDLNRVWTAFIISGGSTPDVGQGASSGAPAPRKSGCGSCSSHACGTC